MATRSSTTREFRVQPHGSNAETDSLEIFQLSDLDHLMPKLYVHVIEIFEISAVTDKQQIVDTLVEGLSRTLGDYPILTGTLHFDNAKRRIIVKKEIGDSVAFNVKTIGPDCKELPTFTWLDQKDFPVHRLDAAQVLPSAFVGQSPVPARDITVDGPPVCGFQVSFIEGGLILGLAVTNQICDGPGCEAVFTSWAKHSSTAAHGLAYTKAPRLPERSILTAKGEPISDDKWAQIGAKFSSFKPRNRPPAPPPADVKLPVVKTRIWHIPKSRLQELKAIANSERGPTSEKKWISTYDGALAILWRAIVRAKKPLLMPIPSAPSKVIHAVNARGRADPPIPNTYIGSAVTLPQSKVVTVADVLNNDLQTTLPLLAKTVRCATNSITPSYMNDLLAWAAGCHDLRWVEVDMHRSQGLDCMAFDWHTMKSYQVHDFGFGTPKALRWPHPSFEGFLFVLPTRVSKVNPDEGFEICICLEESCYARFEVDAELLHFAEQRGVNV